MNQHEPHLHRRFLTILLWLAAVIGSLCCDWLPSEGRSHVVAHVLQLQLQFSYFIVSLLELLLQILSFLPLAKRHLWESSTERYDLWPLRILHDMNAVCVWPPRVRSGSDRSMCVRRSSRGFGCHPPSSPASLWLRQEGILCPDWLVSLFQLGWCRTLQLQVSETSVAALQEEQLVHLYDTFKGTVHPKRTVLLPFMCLSSGVGNIVIMSSELMNDQAFTFMHSAFAFNQSDLQKRNKRDSSKIQQYS